MDQYIAIGVSAAVGTAIGAMAGLWIGAYIFSQAMATMTARIKETLA